MVAMGKRPIEDAMTALVCHGALSRHPDLRIISVENGAGWIKALLKSFADVYAKMPNDFLDDPVAAFKRGVYVTPFWEENFQEVVDIMGADRCVFGSDWPHPEGLSDPITFVDDLKGLPEADIAKIMGGNMMSLMKVGAPVPA
jgi:predicted TIM-barrel fold metal-dependent hydrolase